MGAPRLRPSGRRASRSVLHALRHLACGGELPSFNRKIRKINFKKWLNSFLFQIKREINLLKTLSTLRNTYISV